MSEFVHFGPIWGRPSGYSMALCVTEKPNTSDSYTITRRATVTCKTCLDILRKKRPASEEELLASLGESK